MKEFCKRQQEEWWKTGKLGKGKSGIPLQLGVPKFSRELGRVSNFNKSINWHHYMKDHVEIGHLTNIL